MSLDDFLKTLQQEPENVSFAQTMAVIGQYYQYTPSAFKNGRAENQAGTNEGSCKLFAFAKLNNLNEAQTLACFGDYYREDVLQNPDGSDHANIRNFIVTGWQGLEFERSAESILSTK